MAEVWRFFAHEDDFADLDEAGACERLGRVLSFPTISSMDAEAVDWQPFDDLRAYMQQAWPRVFVAGEVDRISSPGYNPARRIAGGNYSGIDLRRIVTNLCVMDFGGPDHAIRVVALHPGVAFAEVQEATGFDLIDAAQGETPLPTADQLAIIESLDPHGIRHTIFKDNPAAERSAA